MGGRGTTVSAEDVPNHRGPRGRAVALPEFPTGSAVEAVEEQCAIGVSQVAEAPILHQHGAGGGAVALVQARAAVTGEVKRPIHVGQVGDVEALDAYRAG